MILKQGEHKMWHFLESIEEIEIPEKVNMHTIMNQFNQMRNCIIEGTSCTRGKSFRV